MSRFPVDRTKTLLRAASGCQRALGELHEQGELDDRGLAPALALCARSHGAPQLPSWHAELRRSAVHTLLVEEALRQVTRALRAADVSYVVIKGASLFTDYDDTVARPCKDLDLLVAPADLTRARKALESDGWTSLYPGPRAERYLTEEGYAWQAQKPGSTLLELHHGLWNTVSPALAARVLAAATTTPGGAEIPSRAARYVLAATHAWLEPAPRRLLDFLDVVMIGRSADHDGPTVQEIHHLAAATDLQLPVALAARVARRVAGGLHDQVEQRLRPELRALERQALERAHPDTTSPRILTLLRMFSGRRTRLGSKSLLRAFWAHPGVVERATPSHLPWWQRRARVLLRDTHWISRPS